MSIKQQILAYLVDKEGKVYETLTIIAKDKQADVKAMNSTCHAATDGKLFWTLRPPTNGTT
jgi:hypothetical protein